MAQIILWNSTEQYPNQEMCLEIRKRAGGTYAIQKWLTMHGYSVEVIDFAAYLDPEDLLNITLSRADNDTICLGMNMTFMNYFYTGWYDDVAERVLEKYPNIKLVAGGQNMIMENFQFRLPWHTLPGHGEDIFLRWLDELTGKNIGREPFSIQRSTSKYPDNMFTFPNEVMDLELSRGCQFKCSFCRYPLLGKKKGTYIRERELIREEILHNYERFGTTRYRLACDTFNEDADKVKLMWEIAQEVPFELEWTGFLRMDLMNKNPDQLDMLVESGMRGVFFGIETMNKPSARAIAKGWNSSIQAQEYLIFLNEFFKEKRIRLKIGMIVGLPGDSRESLDRDFQFIIREKINCSFTPLSILNPKVVKQSHPSLFDKEYQKYGYNFVENNPEPSFWVNEKIGMNYHDAHHIAQNFNKVLRQRSDNKFCNWRLFDYADTMNVSIDEAYDQNADFWKNPQRVENIRKKAMDDIKLYVSNML